MSPQLECLQLAVMVPNCSKFTGKYICFCVRDETPGSDSWAVHQGWVSVTPLGLKADIATRQQVSCHTVGTIFTLLQLCMSSAVERIHTGG